MIDELVSKINNKNTYDIEEYKMRKKEQKENAYKIIDEALEELKTSPEALKNYFDIQSRFDGYSPKNALLISKQCPNATWLKTRKDWQEAKVTFKNSKPNIITILKPSDPYEIDGKTLTSYNAKDMIDVSETNCKTDLKNYDKKFILQALIHECPIDIKVVDSLESGNICECNMTDKVLYVSRDEINGQYIKAVATELAKMNLYENSQEIDNDKAECIGYMVCKKYGIETDLESLNRISHKFSGMEKQEIVTELTSMKEVLQDINNNMGQYLDNKRKEIKNKEQER